MDTKQPGKKMKSVLVVNHPAGFERDGVKLKRSVIPIEDRKGFNDWITSVYFWNQQNRFKK